MRYGVLEVLRRYPRGVFTAMGLRFAENIMYYLVVTFSITYLVVNEVNTAEILGYMVIAHIVHMIVIPLIGGLADRIGRKPVYFIGAVLAGTWGFFAFPMFDTKSPVVILLAICIGLVIHAFMYASQPAIMSEMFPTRMRYSGVSLGYQVTSIVAGSLAPIIAAGSAAEVRLVGPGRDLPRDRRCDHARRGHLAARDEGLVAARARPHRRGAPGRRRAAARVRA